MPVNTSFFSSGAVPTSRGGTDELLETLNQKASAATSAATVAADAAATATTAAAAAQAVQAGLAAATTAANTATTTAVSAAAQAASLAASLDTSVSTASTKATEAATSATSAAASATAASSSAAAAASSKTSADAARDTATTKAAEASGSATAAASSATSAAASATTATTKATEAASSATSAGSSATAAATSASTASSKATEAATSATNAASSASAASTSASSAASSASAASTSATSAANSATAAASSASSAASAVTTHVGAADPHGQYIQKTGGTFSGAVTYSPGTANGVLFLNGSKVVSSGSALTFDGSTLNVSRVGDTIVQIAPLTAGTARLNLNGIGGGAGAITSSQNGLFLTNTDTGPFVWGINSTEQMRLTPTGLGIGTSSPGAKLDVSGNAVLSGVSGFKYLYFNGAVENSSLRFAKIGKNYDSTFELGIWASTHSAGNSAATVFYRDLTTESMRIDPAGNLGIGTSSPTARVHAYSGTAMKQLTVDGVGGIKTGINFANGGTTYGQIYFDNNAPYDMSVVQQYTTGSLIFGTNNTERARITSAGDFIQTANTTAPTLSTNGTLAVQRVSDTQLKFLMRGSDGVTRSVTLTLT